MKKSIIAVFMTVMCAVAFAQNAESDFTINSNGAITKYEGWDTAVVIPERINGIRVTSINREAFASNGLTSVTIPQSVYFIGSRAFYNNKLTSVTIPGYNVWIGEEAFANNPIASITLGSDHEFHANIVPMVNNRAWSSLFYDYICNDRKGGTYTLNRGVGISNIKRDGDFQYIETPYGACITGYTGSSGNRLVIPSVIAGLTVKALSDLGSTRISRMQIPDSVTYIDNDAFRNNQLTSITIPDSVTYIGNNAFSDNQLTSVTIGNSVTYIKNGAFSGNQLTSVTIPNSVTYIGNGAFSGNQLTSVTIDNRVTLSNEAFPSGFVSAYNANGRTAGTYIWDNDSSNWTKQ
jgi:hypothetical protein